MRVKISTSLVPYNVAVEVMEKEHALAIEGKSDGLIWFLQHEDVYTAGVSAKETELLAHNGIPVLQTRRGGKFTYHGEGQLICYIVCNLKKYTNGKLPDVRCFVACLEDIVIQTLQKFGIKGEVREGRIGVWVQNQEKEEKISAIGVKFSKGATMHGFAINVRPNLQNFKGIIPCGISEFGVCSIESLGINTTVEEVRDVCKQFVLEAEKNGFFQKSLCKNF